LLDLRLDQFGGFERVGPRRELNRDAGTRTPVDVHVGAVVFRAQFDPRDVA
jgi:hypothetical protein